METMTVMTSTRNKQNKKIVRKKIIKTMAYLAVKLNDINELRAKCSIITHTRKLTLRKSVCREGKKNKE